MKKIILGLSFLMSLSIFAESYYVQKYESKSNVARYQDMISIEIEGEAAQRMFEKGLEVNGVLRSSNSEGIDTVAVKFNDFNCFRSEIVQKNVIRFSCFEHLLDSDI